MKKLFIFMIVMFCFTRPAFCIFGIEKILPDLNLFKQEVKGDLNGIKVENAQMKSEITGLRLQVKELNIKLEAQNKMIAGANNQINETRQEIRAGRDAYMGSGNTNEKEIFKWQIELAKYQADIWKRLFYMQLKFIVLPLLGVVIWALKYSMKENSNARYYQVEIAKYSKNGEFDEMMKQKRMKEDEKRHKRITSQAVNAVKQYLPNLFKGRQL